MSKDNSEPAFPSDSNEFGTVLGMSLRDYFAGKILQGICSHSGDLAIGDDNIAIAAYELADAMLSARAAADVSGFLDRPLSM